MTKRTLIASLMVSMLVLGIVGPAGAQSATPGKIIFTMGSTYDLISPNPFKSVTGADYETLFLTYDMLFNFSQKDLSPTSGLAYYPPEQSSDGLTWTFKIRSGVKWSDGVPLTAKDVAFTFNFIWKNHLATFYPYIGYPASFTAPDDTTFVWKMAKPTLSPLIPPWLPIVPEHIWAKYDGKDQKTIKEVQAVPSVGSGPFTLDTWKPGQYWSLTANKDYWGGAPHIDGVVFRTYQNPEALKLALENGEVDAAEALPPNVFQSVQNQPDISTNVSAPNYFDNLAFNFEGTADPSLQNLDVRKAIEYAINKQELVNRVTLGYGEPGASVILPTYTRWAWAPDASQAINFNPDQAKALLDQAGYKDINGDGFRETPNGQPWSLQVLTISDVTYSVPEGKLIVGWMNDVGIKTSIKTVSESKAYDIWGAQTFDMYVWGWGPDPDPEFILSIFTKSQCVSQGGYWSDGCWSDPAFEKLYSEQHLATNFDARHQEVLQAQQLLYQQIPEVVLLYEEDLQAYRNDRFTGFVTQPEPKGSIFFAFGAYSYLNIKPVNASADTSTSSSGIPIGVWIAIVAGVLVIIGAVVLLRRRGAREDVE